MEKVFQAVDPSQPESAVFEGRDQEGKEVYLELPPRELHSLDAPSPTQIVVQTAKGPFPLQRPSVLFDKKGLLVFTSFTNDPSCGDGGMGTVIWVKGEDRRQILPRHLSSIRRIEWGARADGVVTMMDGVPGDNPMGKGLARIPLEGGRKELQSFNPKIGEKELKAILAILPSPGEGLEESFPVFWPPRGSDFPDQEGYLRYFQMTAGMSEEVRKRLASHPVPPGFLPLRKAILEFFEKKALLDQAVESYARNPDTARLRKGILAAFPGKEVEVILDRATAEASTLGVLDQLDNLLYRRVYQLFLNHGPAGRLAVSLLEENRVRVVVNPLAEACPAPPGTPFQP